MALIGTVAGFATFGLAARGLALSIQRRALSSGKARRSNLPLSLRLRTRTGGQDATLGVVSWTGQYMDGGLSER